MSPSRDLRETVLFAVVGFSPAILTETAWALAQERPRVVPRRVVAVTTLPGRERIREELLRSGVWEDLRRAVKAGAGLEFGDTGAHIRVVNRGTAELEDIRSREDNAAAADFILEELRKLVENPDVRVVATIAGGRKTMGALLYACMSLIGREGDRVTHVLVDDRLERRQEPKFHFPRTAAERRSGIQLADIPFVPLRNRFVDLGRMPGSFSSLVAGFSRQLRDDRGPAAVRLDPDGYRVTVDGVSVSLRRRAFVTLQYLVELNRSKRVPEGLNVREDDFKTFAAQHDSQWTTAALDDLKHEVSELRTRLKAAGIAWRPGDRRDALRLPPFQLA